LKSSAPHGVVDPHGGVIEHGWWDADQKRDELCRGVTPGEDVLRSFVFKTDAARNQPCCSHAL